MVVNTTLQLQSYPYKRERDDFLLKLERGLRRTFV